MSLTDKNNLLSIPQRLEKEEQAADPKCFKNTPPSSNALK